MNLKEAFRYQTFIDQMLGNTRYNIETKAYAYEETKIHHRNASNPGHQDKTEIVSPQAKYSRSQMVNIALALLQEKILLSNAIAEAKASISICGQHKLDSSVEANKQRQLLARSLQSMLMVEDAQSLSTGYDYHFNAEGNQVRYAYEVETNTKVCFDRNAVRNEMHNILEEADAISSEIDKALINTEVEYEIFASCNSSFDEVCEVWIAKGF